MQHRKRDTMTSPLDVIQQNTASSDLYHAGSTAHNEVNVNPVSGSASMGTPSSRGTHHAPENIIREDGNPTTTSAVHPQVVEGLGMEEREQEKISGNLGLLDEGMIEQFQNSTITDPHWDDAVKRLRERSNTGKTSVTDRVVETHNNSHSPEEKEGTRDLRLETLHTPVIYKTLPAFLCRGRTIVPNVIHIHKCPTPYFLEAFNGDAHVGTLVLTSDGHSRRSVGRLDVKHRYGCLSSEQTQAFFTTTEPTVIIYKLKHHSNLNLCEVVFYRELVIEGAVQLVGITCCHSTGLLAVGDAVRNRITLIHPDGSHLHHISLAEAGVQMEGGLTDLTWGSTERCVYLNDVRGADDPERGSVLHLELYPPRVRWRAPVVYPVNLWYRRGLLYVLSPQRDSITNHMLILSAHDGQLIKQFPSYPGINPTGLSEEDNQEETTVIIQYDWHSPSSVFPVQDSAADEKINLTGMLSNKGRGKQNPKPADHSDLHGTTVPFYSLLEAQGQEDGLPNNMVEFDNMVGEELELAEYSARIDKSRDF